MESENPFFNVHLKNAVSVARINLIKRDSTKSFHQTFCSCRSLFLLLSMIFGVSVCILRRHRMKTCYHALMEPLGTMKHALARPTIIDYDNVTYEALRHQMQFSSSDDNDSSTMTASEQYSYESKAVFFGGEQQLTAISA
jgi:hypothetical protein